MAEPQVIDVDAILAGGAAPAGPEVIDVDAMLAAPAPTPRRTGVMAAVRRQFLGSDAPVSEQMSAAPPSTEGMTWAQRARQMIESNPYVQLQTSAARGALDMIGKARKAPTLSEKIGYGAAAALPFVGPSAASAGETIGAIPETGDLSGAATETAIALAGANLGVKGIKAAGAQATLKAEAQAAARRAPKIKAEPPPPLDPSMPPAGDTPVVEPVKLEVEPEYVPEPLNLKATDGLHSGPPPLDKSMAGAFKRVKDQADVRKAFEDMPEQQAVDDAAESLGKFAEERSEGARFDKDAEAMAAAADPAPTPQSDLDALRAAADDAPEVAEVSPKGEYDPRASEPLPGPVKTSHRSILNTLGKMPHIGEALRKRVEGALGMEREVASSASADLLEVKNTLSKQEQRDFGAYMEGELQPTSPGAIAAVERVRGILDGFRKQAEGAGVLVGDEGPNYFPHRFKDGEWSFTAQVGHERQRTGKSRNLEREREGREGYRRDFSVLEEYALEAAKRIAVATHLGKNLEGVQALISRAPVDKRAADYVSTSINRVFGLEKPAARDRVYSKIRSGQAIVDLPFAGVSQIANQAHLAAEVGLRTYSHTIADVFRQVLTGKGKDLEVAATRSGALFSTLKHEVADAARGGKGWMWGVPTVDKWGRIIANHAAKMAPGVNPGEVLALGRRLADETQLRVAPERLPLWMSSPEGKLASQYATFMIEHAKFVDRLFKEAKAGKPQKLARFLAVTAPVAGEMVADVKAWLRGQDAWGDDPESWESIIRARRVAPNGASGVAMRVLQNISTAGGIGFFQTMLERSLDMKRNPVAWMGRFGSTLADAGEAFAGAIEGDAGKVARVAVERGVPGYGREISKEFMRDEATPPPSKPGLVGRIKDTVTGETKSPFEVSAARKVAGELETAQKQRKEAADALKRSGLKPEKEPASLEERLSRTRKGERRLEVEKAIREAIQDKSWAKARRIARDANRKYGYDFKVDRMIKDMKNFESEEEE